MDANKFCNVMKEKIKEHYRIPPEESLLSKIFAFFGKSRYDLDGIIEDMNNRYLTSLMESLYDKGCLECVEEEKKPWPEISIQYYKLKKDLDCVKELKPKSQISIDFSELASKNPKDVVYAVWDLENEEKIYLLALMTKAYLETIKEIKSERWLRKHKDKFNWSFRTSTDSGKCVSLHSDLSYDELMSVLDTIIS